MKNWIMNLFFIEMKNTKRVEILNKYNYKFKNHPKFDEEFDNLKGKCSSLEEDFMKFKKALLINLETNNHRLTHDVISY